MGCNPFYVINEIELAYRMGCDPACVKTYRNQKSYLRMVFFIKHFVLNVQVTIFISIINTYNINLIHNF